MGFGKLAVGNGLPGVGVGVGLFPCPWKQCPAKTKPLQVLVGAGVGAADAVGFGVYGPSRFQGVPPKTGVGKLCTGMLPNIFCA